jgi:hypothetical protein
MDLNIPLSLSISQSIIPTEFEMKQDPQVIFDNRDDTWEALRNIQDGFEVFDLFELHLLLHGEPDARSFEDYNQFELSSAYLSRSSIPFGPGIQSIEADS